MSPPSAHGTGGARRRPRGVIVVALLLASGALMTGAVALAPSATLAAAGLPRSLLIVSALLTAVLAYGLLRLRRWAWAAMLSFVVINACFLLARALLSGGVPVGGLALLLALATYLLLPGVRAAFWRADEGAPPSSPANEEEA